MGERDRERRGDPCLWRPGFRSSRRVHAAAPRPEAAPRSVVQGPRLPHRLPAARPRRVGRFVALLHLEAAAVPGGRGREPRGQVSRGSRRPPGRARPAPGFSRRSSHRPLPGRPLLDLPDHLGLIGGARLLRRLPAPVPAREPAPDRWVAARGRGRFRGHLSDQAHRRGGAAGPLPFRPAESLAADHPRRRSRHRAGVPALCPRGHAPDRLHSHRPAVLPGPALGRLREPVVASRPCRLRAEGQGRMGGSDRLRAPRLDRLASWTHRLHCRRSRRGLDPVPGAADHHAEVHGLRERAPALRLGRPHHRSARQSQPSSLPPSGRDRSRNTVPEKLRVRGGHVHPARQRVPARLRALLRGSVEIRASAGRLRGPAPHGRGVRSHPPARRGELPPARPRPVASEADPREPGGA